MEKLEYVITIKLPNNKVVHASEERKIYLYRGNLYLDDYSYTIEVFPDSSYCILQ